MLCTRSLGSRKATRFSGARSRWLACARLICSAATRVGAEIAAAGALRIFLVESRTRRRLATRLAGENALPFRRDRGRAHIVTPLAQVAIAHVHTLRADATAADEDVAADRGDCVRPAAVGIGMAGPFTAPSVHVRDVDVVHDDRVGHVHVAHVARRVPVPRHVHFARREREPAHAVAERQGHVHGRSADPADERRRVVRTDVSRTRHPAPAMTHERPASVVEGREAPARVVDPGPAPRRDPAPAAVAIRRPVLHDVPRAATHGRIRARRSSRLRRRDLRNRRLRAKRNAPTRKCRRGGRDRSPTIQMQCAAGGVPMLAVRPSRPVNAPSSSARTRNDLFAPVTSASPLRVRTIVRSVSGSTCTV